MKRDQRKKDFVAHALAAWGGKMPDWIETLARKVNASSLGDTARIVGYSASALSYVLSNSYAGDIGRVEKAVRGSLMNETVRCPIVGEIGLHRCLVEQKKDFRGSSAIRTKLFNKCRGIGTERCPHSLIGRESGQ